MFDDNDCPEEVNGGEKVTADELVTVVRYLVNDLAAEKDFSTDQVRELTIRDLYRHVNESFISPQERTEIAEQLKVPSTSLDWILDVLFNDPFYVCGAVLPIWSVVTTPSPPVRHKPLKMISGTTFLFADGVLSRMTNTAQIDPDAPLTNGAVLAQMRFAHRMLEDETAKLGVDEIYRHGIQPSEVDKQILEVARALQPNDPP